MPVTRRYSSQPQGGEHGRTDRRHDRDAAGRGYPGGSEDDRTSRAAARPLGAAGGVAPTAAVSTSSPGRELCAGQLLGSAPATSRTAGTPATSRTAGTPATSRTAGTSGWAAAPKEHGMRGACDRTTATDTWTPGHLDAWTPILAFARTRWELADFADATLRDGSCRVRVPATVAGRVIRSATGQGVASR